MYIVIAIVAFGLLIAVHEIGHFSAAKLLGVRVSEFAIGMGPKLLKKQGKETLYTLRLLPFGGFCAMDEDSEAVDARSFTAQKRWRRVVILAAGGVANFVAAFIIIVILTMGMKGFIGTTLTGLFDGFPLAGENGLMVGDRIVSINGERLYYRDDFELFMNLYGDKQIDLVIQRGEEMKKLEGITLKPREYIIDGETVVKYGMIFNEIKPGIPEKLKYSCYSAMNFVRMIRVSIAQLISGAAGVKDLSGPVGIVSVMSTAGQSATTVAAGLENIAYITALIGVNLAVMNLLPIPALDGGRILFIFITWAIEKTTKRRLNPKYEGYIHTGVLVLLMGFMVFILVNDVLRLVGG